MVTEDAFTVWLREQNFMNQIKITAESAIVAEASIRAPGIIRKELQQQLPALFSHHVLHDEKTQEMMQDHRMKLRMEIISAAQTYLAVLADESKNHVILDAYRTAMKKRVDESLNSFERQSSSVIESKLSEIEDRYQAKVREQQKQIDNIENENRSLSWMLAICCTGMLITGVKVFFPGLV